MKKGKQTGSFLSLFLGAAALFLCAAFPGCSSAPEKPDAVYTDRNTAGSQLNLANQLANRGRYADAMLILQDARRLAVSSDDPPLRLKTAISRGSVLFATGRHDEAFLLWDNTALEGDASGEQLLASLARVYAIRARLALLSLEDNGNTAEAAAKAEEYRAMIETEMPLLEDDDTALAAAYLTLGMALKQADSYEEAETALGRAVSIYEEALSLEDAAYAWFVIASVRSLAGEYDAALAALEESRAFDRRAENGFGLASTWQAKGEVLEKAGRGGEALAARRRAVDIFRAIALPEKAEALEKQFGVSPGEF